MTSQRIEPEPQSSRGRPTPVTSGTPEFVETGRSRFVLLCLAAGLILGRVGAA